MRRAHRGLSRLSAAPSYQVIHCSRPNSARTAWGNNPGAAVPRPQPIVWPNKAKIAVTFIVPWEVWPENFATRESHQRSSHRAPPANATFAKNMAAVTEREYGDRVGIWRLMDLFDRHELKVTMLMNGLKVEHFADACREIKAKGHEFSSESYEHEYSY